LVQLIDWWQDRHDDVMAARAAFSTSQDRRGRRCRPARLSLLASGAGMAQATRHDPLDPRLAARPSIYRAL
jgi:hypothetical protein